MINFKRIREEIERNQRPIYKRHNLDVNKELTIQPVMPRQEEEQVIFVHIPKTGGGTFRRYLDSVYPNNYRDRLDNIYYNSHIDMPSHVYPQNAEGYDLITGHFYARKYGDIGARLITFVRHPVDRVISSYYYMLKYFNSGHFTNEKILLIERNMDIIQWAALTSNTMTKYLGLNLAIFEFIGVLEDKKRSYEEFTELFGKEPNHKLKQRFNKSDRPEVSDFIKKKIADLNGMDMELYNQIRIMKR